MLSIDDFIYTEERIGKDRKPFIIHKIRSMEKNARDRQDDEDIASLIRTEHDPRITMVGKYLRRYAIDELLQIPNLLRGEMVFIGIRAMQPGIFEELPWDIQEWIAEHGAAFADVKYAYKPGLTDEEKINLWRKYIEEKGRHATLTDVKYSFMILYNVVFKGRRTV
ncbi:hypothetical protein A3K72_03790 [Candidatus Woesearchaeota archaeon RBG_13_36_6]|nr:MAG: hypothetical protein A3K72_03790 [Candidatus Woesearchaeota archaeon RBG_13_36_6]